MRNTEPARVRLLPSGPAARIFAHSISVSGDVVHLWSYVSDGLGVFGQREVAFSLVRSPEATPAEAPPDPVDLLRTIAMLAKEGRAVGDGGITELDPSRAFLGREALRGFTYQAAWPLAGAELPPGCLSAVALVGHEMDTVKSFGALRVLARIGRAHRFFPTAPWCDPARCPAMPVETQTVLAGVARGQFSDVTVAHHKNQIVLRLPHGARSALAAAGDGLPRQVPLALLTVLDPQADSCLVWTPGQRGPEAISSAGTRASRTSGCFALLVPGQPADGGQVFEDGFALMLTDASSALIRDAFAAGTDLTIRAAEPRLHSMRLEWYGGASL